MQKKQACARPNDHCDMRLSRIIKDYYTREITRFYLHMCTYNLKFLRLSHLVWIVVTGQTDRQMDGVQHFIAPIQVFLH